MDEYHLFDKDVEKLSKQRKTNDLKIKEIRNTGMLKAA